MATHRDVVAASATPAWCAQTAAELSDTSDLEDTAPLLSRHHVPHASSKRRRRFAAPEIAKVLVFLLASMVVAILLVVCEGGIAAAELPTPWFRWPSWKALSDRRSLLGQQANSSRNGTNESSLAPTQQKCMNTPGWTNGFYQCQTVGYEGPGCTNLGLTCEAYEYHHWCFGGHLAQEPSMGNLTATNHPEVNCCVCGGGSREMRPIQAEGVSSSACSARKGCSNFTGECCPNRKGKYLECCGSEPVCEDSIGWANGYVMCAKPGQPRNRFCSPGGVTCAGYVEKKICAQGAVIAGQEDMVGSTFNYPEVHCCACGKGTAGNHT